MRLLLPLGLVALLALPRPATAGFVNGGFEAGTFTGWATAGDAAVRDGTVGALPPGGAFQAFLTTASDLGDFNNFSGVDAAGAAALEAFLGLAGGGLGGNEGSAIAQAVTVNPGDVLTFAYNFLTTEGGQNDFAFLTLKDTASAALATRTVLADRGAATSSSGVNLDFFGDPTFETGYRAYSHTFQTGGTFLVGLGVADAGRTVLDDPDVSIPSGLLLDNVQVGPAAPAGPAVPEPSSLTLALLAGAGGLVGCWRQRRALALAARSAPGTGGPAPR